MTNVPFINKITNELSKRKLKSDVVANAILDIAVGNDRLDDLIANGVTQSDIESLTIGGLTTEQTEALEVVHLSKDALGKINGLKSSASEIDRVSKEIPKTALNALSQAQNRRIDLVMIGDSNQVKDGFGFAGAFIEVLGSKYGLYATGIGGSITTGNERLYNDIPGSVKSGAPALNEALYPSNSPEPYSYVADTIVLNPSTSGVGINPTSKIKPKEELTFWTCWGSFASGLGKFRRFVRYGLTPYTVIASDAAYINTNTGAVGKNFTALTIQADPSRLEIPIECKVALNGGATYQITGPFLEYYSRVENPNTTNGVSVHTLYGEGSQSLWDMATTLQGYSDIALKNFFEETRRLQVSKYQKPIVVVYINSGLNDTSETSTPSKGNFAVPSGSSKEAYADNLNAIIDRIESVYSANWDVKELFFLLMPSHPTGNETEIRLDEYRQKCKETYFNRDRCSYINLRELVTSNYMLEQGYYLAGGSDRYHLNTAGYLDLVGKVSDTIIEF